MMTMSRVAKLQNNVGIAAGGEGGHVSARGVALQGPAGDLGMSNIEQLERTVRDINRLEATLRPHAAGGSYALTAACPRGCTGTPPVATSSVAG